MSQRGSWEHWGWAKALTGQDTNHSSNNFISNHCIIADYPTRTSVTKPINIPQTFRGKLVSFLTLKVRKEIQLNSAPSKKAGARLHWGASLQRHVCAKHQRCIYLTKTIHLAFAGKLWLQRTLWPSLLWWIRRVTGADFDLSSWPLVCKRRHFLHHNVTRQEKRSGLQENKSPLFFLTAAAFLLLRAGSLH